MNEKKLKELFDFQKFEKNSALDFVIQSAHDFVKKESESKTVEMTEDELDMLSAAGVNHPVKRPREIK